MQRSKLYRIFDVFVGQKYFVFLGCSFYTEKYSPNNFSAGGVNFFS